MNLTEEIAGDSDSEYVKLMRIERWLSEHEYSTEIDISAEDLGSPERFMDRFLIENTSGYCSYYATAFVLMARAEGIPARYVEGYRIDENEYATVKV
ncbi:MAG: transglutaminase domain-containing protein, partial [Clostridia bacterium]|nr:transglutaminase domain-containing protein [Clostridia bacterium]